MKKINIGVFGSGRIGKIHITNLLKFPEVELKLVVDPFVDEAFVSSFGLPFAKQREAIFDRKDIDAVIICTPSDTHYDLIKQAIDAKKHIFCEKPIDLDLNRILEIKQILSQSEVFLQVGFNRRFDENFSKIASIVKSGKIGRLVCTRIISRDFAPPPESYVRASGGMFLDMSIHDFDMLFFLTQKRVKSLFVNATNLVCDYASLDVDSALFNIVLEDGSLGVIENCRQAVYGYDQRIEVFGSEGRVFCENKYEDSVVLCNQTSQTRDNPLEFFLERYASSYEREMRYFVDYILAQKRPSVGVDESIEATILALAAQQSHAKKASIEIAAIKEAYGL